MGHVTIDVAMAGSRGQHQLRNILIDTGAGYSVFAEDILKAIGAHELPAKIPLELLDGKVVHADAYAAILTLEGRQSPIIAVTFAGAKPVIGVFSLESLGLKADPVTEKLEETRLKGIAYFYASASLPAEGEGISIL